MITLENLLAFWLFAVVAPASPGPNNMMVLAVFARVGFVRSVPPLVPGIAAGVCMLIISVGLRLGALFESLQWLYYTLRVVGSLYLLYLAWQIASAGVVSEHDDQQATLGFINGATFQLVNPKAWVIAISIVSTYAPEERFIVHVVLLEWASRWCFPWCR